MIRSIFLAAGFAILTASAVWAETPRKVTWDDLLPPAGEIADPFAHLTDDQKVEMEIVASLNQRKKRGILREGDVGSLDLAEFTSRLRAQGVDVEGLLQDYEKFIAEVREQDETVVDALEGELVRIPGYALPLEFSGTAVKEFLLVPYVGACIHVPPPPPNQMVFVELDESFQPDDLYMPVWITGRMSAKGASKSLSYVDGSTDVTFGYSLKGVSVEPFEEVSLNQ